MKSKYKSNDQELIQSNLTRHPQNLKGKSTQSGERLRKTPTANLINTFLKQMAIQIHQLKTAVISILPIFFFYITNENKTGRIIRSCYLGDHVAENIYT